MRTDVKIGIAMGAIILIIAVSYYGSRKTVDIPIGNASEDLQAQNERAIDKLFSQTNQLAESKQDERQAPAPQKARNARSNPQRTAQHRTLHVATDADSSTAPVAVASRAQPEATTRELPSKERPVQRQKASAPQGRVTKTAPASADISTTPTGVLPLRAAAGAQAVTAAGTIAESRQAPSSATDGKAGRAVLRTHVIERGDTFAALAERYYGSQRHARFLAESNPQADPYHLRIGAVIKIPPQSEVQQRRREVRRSLRKNEYQVVERDTLYRIADRMLGSGLRWPEIYQLNKDVIGPDPARLKVGQILTLPAAPGQTRE